MVEVESARLLNVDVQMLIKDDAHDRSIVLLSFPLEAVKIPCYISTHLVAS
jgi:hypothetical protein